MHGKSCVNANSYYIDKHGDFGFLRPTTAYQATRQQVHPVRGLHVRTSVRRGGGGAVDPDVGVKCGRAARILRYGGPSPAAQGDLLTLPMALLLHRKRGRPPSAGLADRKHREQLTRAAFEVFVEYPYTDAPVQWESHAVPVSARALVPVRRGQARTVRSRRRLVRRATDRRGRPGHDPRRRSTRVTRRKPSRRRGPRRPAVRARRCQPRDSAAPRRSSRSGRPGTALSPARHRGDLRGAADAHST